MATGRTAGVIRHCSGMLYADCFPMRRHKFYSVIALLVLCSYATADDLQLEGFENWTSRIPILLSAPGVAVVEAKLDGNSGFEVIRSLYGTLQAGRRLSFDQCNQILITGSPVDYLYRVTTIAPVVNLPRKKLNYLSLPHGRELRSFPSPSSNDRFLMILWRIEGQRWSFREQTLHDFFLVHEGKIFQQGYAHTKKFSLSVWMPIMPTASVVEFKAALEQEIAKLPENHK